MQLALWDTAGQEEYERLRPLSYAKSHVILIGFAVDSPDSLDNVGTKWIDEVNRLCTGVPTILVGMKKDLRHDPVAIEEMRLKSVRFVDSQTAQTVANRIGAKRYMECSALTGEGVDDIFEAATRSALLFRDASEESSKGCCEVM